MPYQTILVHVDNTVQAMQRVRLAAWLARTPGCHVIGAALTGVSRLLYHGTPAGDPDAYLALHLAFLRERAVEAVAAFRRAAEANALASFEGRVIDDDAGAGLALHARVSDLVLLSQAGPAGPAGSTPDFRPYVLLHSGRPVLMLPAGLDDSFEPAQVMRRVLVAWDASREAGRALHGALPLLLQANRVSIAVFDDGPGGRTMLDAASADPLPFLARHGVRATLEVHAAGGWRARIGRDSIGEALLVQAADEGASLLVMGAYGHSRMRETILGSVTRTVLATMTLPVLLEH
jgi:nucleotide-binding universal stress UspA family protein